jgi:putative ABC transport system permease protein
VFDIELWQSQPLFKILVFKIMQLWHFFRLQEPCVSGPETNLLLNETINQAMFRNYFITTWRTLSRSKLYSFINIAGLSLGLACVMLILLYIKDEVSYDRFQAKGSHLYRVISKTVAPGGAISNGSASTGFFPGPRFSANISGITGFVRIEGGQTDIKTGADIRSQELLYVDSNFFSVFSFPLLAGNPKTCLLETNSVVLSEDEAKKQFGTTNAVGKIMIVKDMNDFVPHTVTAVAKRCPQNSSIKFDMLLPLKVSKEDELNNMNWLNFFLNTIVVLSPTADPKAVEAKIDKFYQKDAQESIKEAAEKFGFKDKTVYLLQPFLDMHLSKDFPSDNGLTDASNPMYSYILSGIALFILLIACINFVNLTVARSVKRAKEIGIRKVVGGDRNQLIMQFMGESFFLCFIAFSLAIAVAQLALGVFNDLSNKSLSLSYLLDGKLIASYIGLFFATSLLTGFYPALVLSGYNPVQTLYNRFHLAGKNYLQKSLVVLQFSLASFLIISTLIIFAQFNFLTTQKLGRDDSNLIRVDKSGLDLNQANLFRQQLQRNPDILGVAPKNGGRWGTVAKVNADSIIEFAYETVDETYLPLFKIPVIEGRNFSREYPSDTSQSVLVNESFVKKAGWTRPIGQQVNFWYDSNRKYTVIGVVKDYHYQSLIEAIGPQLFTMRHSNKFGVAFIKIKPGSATASLQFIAKTFKNLFPISPYSYHFLEEEDLKNYDAEAKWKQILLFGAILTIFISAIGLFGLSVLSTEKRTKEIGIRKVLGASVARVVSALSKDFLMLVVLAMVIAMPIAWISANKWLQSYPYRIQLSWVIFALAAVLVVFIGLATVSFQSVKAAMANPVKSLRTE